MNCDPPCSNKDRDDAPISRRSRISMSYHPHRIVELFSIVILLLVVHPATSWGSTSRYSGDDLFSQSGSQNWLYSSSSLAIKVNGCVWGHVRNNGDGDGEGDNNEDGGDTGCLENSSEDGTYYWYKMSNCKRAQVAYSVYGSSSSSATGCNSDTYLQSFVTTGGLEEFMGLLQSYDYNYQLGDDDSYSDLPMCEEDGYGYYISVGCNENGGFTVDKFTDEYCLSYAGNLKTLSSLNSKFSSYSCHSCYSSSTGNSAYKSLCANIVPYSNSCSPLDHTLCYDIDGSKVSGYQKAKTKTSEEGVTVAGINLANTVKYTLGSAFLFSSFIMFLGILSTNRRKRRAMIQRKFRQMNNLEDSRNSSRGKSSRERSASRSRSSRGRSSRGKEDKDSRSKSKRRSKSSSRRNAERVKSEGVFT